MNMPWSTEYKICIRIWQCNVPIVKKTTNVHVTVVPYRNYINITYQTKGCIKLECWTHPDVTVVTKCSQASIVKDWCYPSFLILARIKVMIQDLDLLDAFLESGNNFELADSLGMVTWSSILWIVICCHFVLFCSISMRVTLPCLKMKTPGCSMKSYQT